MFSDEVLGQLKLLGMRLRQMRLNSGETQARFAARLGISIPTLRGMENGDPAVKVGLWAKALWVLDRLHDMDALLGQRGSLFDEYERKRAYQEIMKRRASKGKRR
ncbi:MAG: helix-turn-helix transcriptional regulator [Thermodesulfobacteriota bacterium]